jgi:exopolyphosphatase/guanosine-5'-triphosphate,3'-diphosphate pyrophosphatase
MTSEGAAVAAIDCGTNSTRLLVVGVDGAVLDRLMRITRLGEGVDASRRLSAEAIRRTVSVLGEYRAVMDRHGVARARLVATSAARDAVNGEDFLAAAADVTGVRPELLSGLEEGALSFAGATRHLPASSRGVGPVLVVDIGGGSTELVVGHLPTPGSAPESGPGLAAVTLDMGCVRVSERFFDHDPPLDGELDAARLFIYGELRRSAEALPPLEPGGLMIGLAGTVSTVAALQQQLATYRRAALHHAVLRDDEVRSWLAALSGEDRAARLARPGMVEGRADVIVGGVLILAAVMEHFARTTCLVSEDDILDGLVASLA